MCIFSVAELPRRYGITTRIRTKISITLRDRSMRKINRRTKRRSDPFPRGKVHASVSGTGNEHVSVSEAPPTYPEAAVLQIMGGR